MDFIILWSTTRMVIYSRYWSWLLAVRCAMLSGSGKRTKVFIWKRTNLIARTTSIRRMTMVRSHPAALQRVPSCWTRLGLETRIHSCWRPGTHNRRATNRGCITTLLVQSSIRSSRQRTKCLPWSSARKQRVLPILISWLFDLRNGAWGAWYRKHWPKHPDRQQSHGWRTAFRDARGRRG